MKLKTFIRRNLSAGLLLCHCLLPLCSFSQAPERFGVHLGSLDYTGAAPFINQLGPQIYVRNEVFRDVKGWRQVKGSAGIADCQQYCDASKCVCSCTANSFYYRNPGSRAELLNTPILKDFYANNYNQFIDFYASRYDSIAPTVIQDLVANYPYGSGNDTIYKNYVKFLMQHFSNKVKVWEVGNENNLTQFWDGTATGYGDLVLMASQEVKQNCPTCKVSTSFSSPTINPGWYAQLARVKNSIDIIDAHYGYPTFITPGKLDSIEARCPGKQIISTETGIPDTVDYLYNNNWGFGTIQNAGGSRVRQAQDLVKGNTYMFEEGYSTVYWYLIDMNYGNNFYIYEHNALIDDDINKTPKKAFTAYKTMISMVDSFTTLTKLNKWQYKYDFSNKPSVYVLWCDQGSCTIPSQITGTVTVTDYMGLVNVMQANQIVLSTSPIYVQLGNQTAIREADEFRKNVRIYPNPANTMISVDGLQEGYCEIKIADLMGKELLEAKNQHSMDVSELSGGIYFIVVKQGNNVCTQKLIINNH